MKSTTPLKRKTGLSSNVRLKSIFGLFRFEQKSNLKQKLSIHKNPPTPQKILDGIVSEVVRRSAANVSGMAMCATCGLVTHWKELQCGHFQSRRHIATRYEPKNLAPQCEECNCFNDGENEKFAAYINSTHGCGTAQALREQAREIIHSFPYEQEIEKWKLILKNLVEQQDSVIKF